MSLREPTVEDDRKTAEREKAILREAGTITARSALTWSVAGTGLLCFAIRWMREPLASAQHLISRGDHWSDALMPGVLFTLLGGAFGALLGWRMTSASGLTGTLSWRIGAGAIGLFTFGGAVASTFVFSGSVPVTLWASLFLAALGAMTTMSIFTIWAA